MDIGLITNTWPHKSSYIFQVLHLGKLSYLEGPTPALGLNQGGSDMCQTLNWCNIICAIFIIALCAQFRSSSNARS